MKKSQKTLYLLSNSSRTAKLLAKDIVITSAFEGDSLAGVIMASSETRGNRGFLERSEVSHSTSDILTLFLRHRRNRHRIRVVLMDEEEESNLKAAVQIANSSQNADYLDLYVLASTPESECLLDTLADEVHGKYGSIKIRRVLPVRNSIYAYIFENSIYDDHVQIIDEKWLSLIIIGLNEHSMEMMKAILWCGQMEGYFLRIDVFDQDSKIEDVFYAQCPGIAKRGTRPRFGEDYYDIHFHPGTRVETNQLFDSLDTLNKPSWVCIDAGGDVVNIQLAMAIRAYFARRNLDEGKAVKHDKQAKQLPRIQAIVRSDERASLIEENALHNFRKQYYQIECIGKDSDVYSCKSIFATQFENIALSAHLQWGDKELFESFEYYRRSSLATEIYRKYRDLFVSDPEMKAIVEHRRWNAYMRGTEGYQYGPRRDDLAKAHPSLVAYDNLTNFDQMKDKVITSERKEDSQPTKT